MLNQHIPPKFETLRHNADVFLASCATVVGAIACTMAAKPPEAFAQKQPGQPTPELINYASPSAPVENTALGHIARSYSNTNQAQPLMQRTRLVPGMTETGEMTDPITISRVQTWINMMQVPSPPIDVQLINTSCTNPTTRPACTRDEEPLKIWLDIPKIEQSGLSPNQEARHELGHVFDYKINDAGSRSRFMSIVGLSGPWRSLSNSPHEQFAEAYKKCSYKTATLERDLISDDNPKRYLGNFDYEPTRRQHKLICGLIRRQFNKITSTPSN